MHDVTGIVRVLYIMYSTRISRAAIGSSSPQVRVEPFSGIYSKVGIWKSFGSHLSNCTTTGTCDVPCGPSRASHDALYNQVIV